MTTDTDAQLRAKMDEATAARAAFERAWLATLQSKAEAFARLPARGLAYEIAWHAFRAGWNSRNGR